MIEISYQTRQFLCCWWTESFNYDYEENPEKVVVRLRDLIVKRV